MNAATESNVYEAARLQQIAANKAKLVEIGLLQQVAALPGCVRAKKPVRTVGQRRVVKVVLREQSTRLAGKKPVDYSGATIHHEYGLDFRQPPKRRKTNGSSNAGRPPPQDVTPPYTRAALQAAWEAAGALKQRLTENIGTALVGMKTMMSSHVSGGFWCQAPMPASVALDGCKGTVHYELGDEGQAFQHLPASEFNNAVKNSCPATWDVIWLPRAKGGGVGFSGNWRGFAIDQQLKVGDVILWELLPSKRTFRVYIFRAGHYEKCPELQATALQKRAGDVPFVQPSRSSSERTVKGDLGSCLPAAGGSAESNSSGTNYDSCTKGENDADDSCDRSDRSDFESACGSYKAASSDSGDSSSRSGAQRYGSVNQISALQVTSTHVEAPVIEVLQGGAAASIALPTTKTGAMTRKAALVMGSGNGVRNRNVSKAAAQLRKTRRAQVTAKPKRPVPKATVADDASNCGEIYRVRGLRAMRGASRQRQWLVCWDGYEDPADDTWEVEGNLLGNSPAVYPWLGPASRRPAGMTQG